MLQQSHYPHHAAIAVLEQAPDADNTSLLVNARRLVAISRNANAPSYLEGRVAQGQPLPHAALVPTTGGHDDGEEEASKLRSMVGFLLGIERPGEAGAGSAYALLGPFAQGCGPAAGLEEGKGAGRQQREKKKSERAVNCARYGGVVEMLDTRKMPVLIQRTVI